MKIQTSIKRAATRLMAVAVMAAAAITTAQAAAPALNASGARPLTPQELKDYSLTGKQLASGLTTVGVGQPAYLDALVNANIVASNIVSVTFTLTNKPVTSFAVITNSPLGSNVPPYKMADRFSSSGAKYAQVAGRAMLVPDATGKYAVRATIVVNNYDTNFYVGQTTTNFVVDITAATYTGIESCSACHSGGIVAPDKFTEWEGTLHAHAFEEAINGISTTSFSTRCISCHVVGFDTNSLANNGGFDDVWGTSGWVFPTNLNSGNYAAMPAALRNVANIQCENCHGAGSEHAVQEALHPKSAAGKAAIDVSFAAGDCTQCHDSLTHHYKGAEWNNSLHAVATRSPSNNARAAACARCHMPSGFAAYTETLGTTDVWTGTNKAYTAYEAITCATCHDPHDASNPHQVRTAEVVMLGDGPSVATITNAGFGSLCMNCHQSRSGSYTNSLVGFPLGRPTFAGGTSSFGPHDNPAAEMIEGVNGYTYGKVIPSSAHRMAVTDTCAGCHMNDHYSTNSASPAFTHVGGHSFSMAWSDGTNTYENVEVCAKCHGQISSFDMVKVDYNGDGVIEGIQTEVTKLYDKLSTLLPPTNYVASGNYVADGLVKSPSARTNWQAKFLQATWNYQLVKNDLSKGIHNSAYAVGLLNASIADLTDDFDHDGLSDTWEKAKFGSITAYDGNSDPDHDGVINSLELAAGTNPILADSDGDGINDLAELQAGSNPMDVNDVPQFLVQLLPAGELAFATEAGKTYQVQMVTEMSTSWQTVSTNIPGTGNTFSMLIATQKGGAQAYYRVVKLTP